MTMKSMYLSGSIKVTLYLITDTINFLQAKNTLIITIIIIVCVPPCKTDFISLLGLDDFFYQTSYLNLKIETYLISKKILAFSFNNFVNFMSHLMK